jgi:hypothetical protein
MSLRAKVAYEWAWEVTDDYGDIVACEYWSTFAECQTDAPVGAAIALVQRWGNDLIGEEDRGYAYCQPGPHGTGLVLPEFFDNDKRVPQRFHAELGKGVTP